MEHAFKAGVCTYCQAKQVACLGRANLCPARPANIKLSETPVGQALGQVSGLSPRTMDSIFEQVKANAKRLRDCVGPHDFSIDRTPERRAGKRYGCTKCGGDIDSINRSWYLDGLAHGKL